MQKAPVKALPAPARHYEDEEEDVEEDEEEDAEMTDNSGSEEDSHMDEDELEHSPVRRRRDRQALVKGPDGEYYQQHELDGSDDDDDESYSEGSSVNDSMRRSTSVPTWAQQVGVDAQKAHVMQASLFRVPEESEALRRLDAQIPSKQLSLAPAQARAGTVDMEDGLMPAPYPEPTFYHPSRAYARVDLASSSTNTANGSFVDAGLAFGRSFRASWGPGGSLVHLGKICTPQSRPNVSANSSTLTKTQVPLTLASDDEDGLTSKLLQLHLSKSPIVIGSDGIPTADPSPTLDFASFASLFPSTDHSFEAQLFRLGHALFDELDLGLGESVDVPVMERIHGVRRKAALSAWLEDAVAPAVEGELRRLPAEAAAARAFSFLSGHQVEEACEAALINGDVRLATLIAQAGGDDESKADIGEQLDVWRIDRVDVHIPEDTRRIYGLLAGEVDRLEGSDGTGIEKCADVLIARGLDWKRTLGLHLWYSKPLEASIAEVFDAYDGHREAHPERTAAPKPWYLAETTSTPAPWNPPRDTALDDALYNLIRLYADPQFTLSSLMTPHSFGPSPVDYALPWHLYIILSRCLRARDFTDRDEPTDVDAMSQGEDEDERVEGHSPSADILASSYAHQLEQAGLIQEAAFVLLHIESSVGREKAVKDLLARSAPLLDDWVMRGLAGSLKIPLAWVNEAKGMYCYSQGDVWEAYELYMQAGIYGAAHDIAVLELAPEAVIRDDLELISSLFTRIAGHAVEGWHLRGKAYLDYVDILTKLPELRQQVLDPNAVADAAQAAEMEDLVRSIPRLIGILPDVLRDREDPRHNVALAEMVDSLTHELDASQQALTLSANQLRAIPAEEATKLRHLQNSVSARFLAAVDAAA
ncbi:hypothetical protein PENSPDRAFT_575693 [Peniophora sp. CONT]|nr:hypothetical protein PENSPDRAFT_575693 [Peniophora sp. CONT]